MKIALNIVPAILFTLWIIIIIRDVKKMKEIRRIKGFENSGNYYDVKRKVLNDPTYQNLEILSKLKSFRKKTLLFSFLSLILAVIVLFTVGILTHL